jgi:hypothetical protein
VHLGGLGFDEPKIGLSITGSALLQVGPILFCTLRGLTGLSQAAFTLLLVPPLQRRFGTVRLLKLNALLYFPMFCYFPLLNVLARSDNWGGVVAVLLLLIVWASAMSMAYSERR